MELPSELCIGLPARGMLETIERSPNDGELVLASGVVLRNDKRHQNAAFDRIWSNFMEARAAHTAAQITNEDRMLLCGALLAGGGKLDALPKGLADVVREYDKMPSNIHEQCQAILRPLMAVSIECSRAGAF